MQNMRLIPLILLLLGLGISMQPAAAAPAAEFRVTFLEVGFGNATLVRDGAGFDALIDAGNRSGGDRVLSYLRWLGVDDLEVMVATHPDRDHIGGLIAVLEAPDIGVESLLYNGCPGDTQTWSEFFQAAAQEGLTLTPTAFPDSFGWGGATASTLHPSADETCADDNRASAVLRIDYAQTAWLLTADIDTSIETGLVADGRNLQAEILQVPHHGSASASSQAFLAAAAPQHAIISVGNNGYGLPAPETLARLEEANARLWRSDFHGTIVSVADGQVYRIFNPRALLPTLINKRQSAEEH